MCRSWTARKSYIHRTMCGNWTARKVMFTALCVVIGQPEKSYIHRTMCRSWTARKSYIHCTLCGNWAARKSYIYYTLYVNWTLRRLYPLFFCSSLQFIDLLVCRTCTQGSKYCTQNGGHRHIKNHLQLYHEITFVRYND